MRKPAVVFLLLAAACSRPGDESPAPLAAAAPPPGSPWFAGRIEVAESEDSPISGSVRVSVFRSGGKRPELSRSYDLSDPGWFPSGPDRAIHFALDGRDGAGVPQERMDLEAVYESDGGVGRSVLPARLGDVDVLIRIEPRSRG